MTTRPAAASLSQVSLSPPRRQRFSGKPPSCDAKLRRTAIAEVHTGHSAISSHSRRNAGKSRSIGPRRSAGRRRVTPILDIAVCGANDMAGGGQGDRSVVVAEQSAKLGQMARLPGIVGVQERDPGPARLRDAVVPCGIAARARPVAVKQSEPGVGDLRQDLGAAVGTSVVDRQDLEIAVGLGENGSQAARQMRRLVVHRNHHGEERFGHHAFPSRGQMSPRAWACRARV